MSTLTARERLFCHFYASFPSPLEAAARAGYQKQRRRTAAKLLLREDIQREIGRLQRETGTDAVRAGLGELAFGSAADAVSLLFAAHPPSREELHALSLSGISEIKQQRGGGLEIKFYDRLKALELLAGLQERQPDRDSGLAGALLQGARALRESGCKPS